MLSSGNVEGTLQGAVRFAALPGMTFNAGAIPYDPGRERTLPSTFVTRISTTTLDGFGRGGL
ncbi:hypothetical protein GCM10012278_24690 [Nonomuraea glycinis]|uniref:Uncharacterized protein n=1 Tax=Nonomuraea glycinis TaxID=2047744 RepID=A0A918A318_9ACTN|nr:hypothetical protein GCM10012278_24690 [Nonomuraea glycinis]